MLSRRKIEAVTNILSVTLLLLGVFADTCGTYQYTDLVKGGTPALDPYDWPWIVGLFHQTDDGPEFKCGATLVSRNIVVTAAHCVQIFNEAYYTLDAEDILLVMGRTRIQNWTEQGNVQTRIAENVVIHPTYLESKRTGADFAYLELGSAVDITDNVTPVCLWNEDSDREQTGNIGMVVGWGLDENNVSVTETPRKIQLPIVDLQTCLSSNGNFKNLVTDLKFCAGKRDGTGPCNGDSGSGMYVTRTRPDGEMSWVMRGLVSRSLLLADGSGVCDLDNYIIFTDVAKLMPWVKNTSCSFRHPDTFGALNMTRLGDKYYYVELQLGKSWASAQQFCRSHGLQLASVETEEENNLIWKFISGKIPVNWIRRDFWLGGSDSQQEGTWSWTNGQKLNFTDWAQGEPDNYDGDEDCLLMGVWREGIHRWWDLQCSYHKKFVCELEDVCS